MTARSRIGGIIGLALLLSAANAGAAVMDFDGTVVQASFFVECASGPQDDGILTISGGCILNDNEFYNAATSGENIYATIGSTWDPPASGPPFERPLTGIFTTPVDSLSLDAINGTYAANFTLTAFDASLNVVDSASVALDDPQYGSFVANLSVAGPGITSFEVTSDHGGTDPEWDFAVDTIVYSSSPGPISPDLPRDDTYTIYQDQVVSLDVLSNDLIVTSPTPGVQLLYATTSNGTPISVDSATNTITFGPGTVVGTDSFAYRIGAGATKTGIVHLVVVPPCTDETVAYTTEATSGELSAVDLNTGFVRVIASGLSGPHGVVLNARKTIAYVTESTSGELSAVELRSGVVSVIATGLGDPTAVVLNVGETHAYVIERGTGELSSIALASGATTLITTGLNAPAGLALDQANTTAYVTESATGDLLSIDLLTETVNVVASGLSSPTAVVLNHDETVAYVAEAGSAELSAIDLTAGTVTLIHPLTAGATQLVAPSGLALDAAGDTLYVTDANRPWFFAVDIATGNARLVHPTVSSGAVQPSDLTATAGVALACEPLQTGTISVPVRWCGVAGAPSIDDPGQVLEATVDDVLLHRLQRTNEGIYLPQVDMLFRSAATAAVPNIPIIQDQISEPGSEGNVASYSDAEFYQLTNDCRAAWEALDPASIGIPTVHIRRFVDSNGDPDGMIGLASMRAPGNAAAANGAVNMVIDNAFVIPCEAQPVGQCLNASGSNPPDIDAYFTQDIHDTLTGHELGHNLTLNHGNGIDDDHDGELDELGERDLNGDGLVNEQDQEEDLNGPNLMQYWGGTEVTLEQAVRMRDQAMYVVAGSVAESGPMPLGSLSAAGRGALANMRSDALGDVPPSEAFIDIDSFGIAVDQAGARTILHQAVKGLLPANITGLLYEYIVDLDNDPATGGAPADIGIATSFQGAELVGRIQVDVVNGNATAIPTVFRYQDGTFVAIPDPGIEAQVVTKSVMFDGRSPGPARVDIGHEVQLILPSDIRGEMDLDMRVEYTAQYQGRDVASAPLTLRPPALASCVAVPQTIQAGAPLTIHASGLPAGMADAFLGEQQIWTGAVESSGTTTAQFVVPMDTRPGKRSVMIKAAGTAITAVCTASVKAAPLADADVTPPVLTPPADVTVDACSVTSPLDIGQATATDDSAVTIINDAPLAFPLGTTPVRWTAIDAHGNLAAATQNVSVVVDVEGLLSPLQATLAPEGSPLGDPNKAFKQGRTLPLKLHLLCGGQIMTNGDVRAPEIVRLSKQGETAENLVLIDLDAGSSNDNGTRFRFSDGQWIYNLDTSHLTVGTYLITIQMPDDRRYSTLFALR